MVSTSRLQTLLESGIQSVRNRKGEPARAALAEALSLAPRDRAVRYWLGNALRLCGQFAQAETMFRELLDEEPTDGDTGFALAFLLREQGKSRQAADVLLAFAATTTDFESLLRIAGFLRDGNTFDAAIEVMKRAIEIQPRDGGLHFRLARLYQATGDFDAALEHVRQTLARDPTLGGAWISLAELQKFSDRTAPDWRSIVDAAGKALGAEADMCVAFAHGKGLDDLGEWAAAWRAYRRGNQLAGKARPWDRAAWTDWHRAALEQQQPVEPLQETGDRHPVYIVGMLRSGTTLLEQLLDRHSQIHGRGELNFLAHLASGRNRAGITRAESRSVANELWTHLQLEGPAGHRYIDKNPLNFRFIGFLFSVLPEAKVIHVRRDGRDSCLSCFFHLFQHRDAGFSNRLEDLVDYYRGYRQLMRHWERSFPDRICRVDYESMVSATRPVLERVIQYLGLEWEEGVVAAESDRRPVRTASAWQARQPLHAQSIGRWRNYYDMAPDFFDALAEIDAEFDRGLTGPTERVPDTA